MVLSVFFMADNPEREMVYSLIASQGPMLPSQVKQHSHRDLIFIQAFLADLTSSKRLRVSHLKIGGSPLYYALGQEAKLQNFAGHLKGIEKEAYELLKDHKLIRADELDPQTRVALSMIKDYSKPIEAQFKEGNVLFFKWYLLSNEDAGIIIRKQYLKQEHKTEETIEPTPEPIKEEIKQSLEKEVETVTVTKNVIEEVQKEPEVDHKTEPARQEKAETSKNYSKFAVARDDLHIKEQQSKLWVDDIEDEFFQLIKQEFKKRNIEVDNVTITRKNSELDLIILVPSAIGNVRYFCKAKNKKKVNDGDFASAYLQGQNHKLPVLFLTTGESTKKALTLLETDFKGMSFLQIESE